MTTERNLLAELGQFADNKAGTQEWYEALTYDERMLLHEAISDSMRRLTDALTTVLDNAFGVIQQFCAAYQDATQQPSASMHIDAFEEYFKSQSEE